MFTGIVFEPGCRVVAGVNTVVSSSDAGVGVCDERISTAGEPTHDDLCEREQRFLLRAIDEDVDLSAHMNDAVKSLKIVLGADESVRTGRVVQL